MVFKTVNPATEEVLATFEGLTEEELSAKVLASEAAFKLWSSLSLDQRKNYFKKLKLSLESNQNELSRLITLEMGKPITESKAEVSKSISLIDYYLTKIDDFLKPQLVKTSAVESYTVYQPLGVVLAVMPWNFPLWQVMRFAVPTLLSGNVGLLKHASNVPQVSQKIDQIFQEAEFPKATFQNLLIKSGQVSTVISNPIIKAVTLTGSEGAGKAVASQAGELIKPTLLELGGSDPFIVLADADLKLAVKNAVLGRFLNNGQSCIAAKRFLVQKDVYELFRDLLLAEVGKLKIGDPLDPEVQLGPLATSNIRQEISNQVKRAQDQGAQLLLGGEFDQAKKGFYYPVTILGEVTTKMDIFDEETFGPVIQLIKFETIKEAIDLANQTEFGLGASIHTQDLTLAKEIIPQLEAGSVFVNSIVKSDPALPFGGLKKSGYGRELAASGALAFCNLKTIVIN